MRLIPVGCLALLCSLSLPAQDAMWVANRTSADIHQVSLCGDVLNVVSIGSNLRRVYVAQDEKLWVIKFITGTFDIRNPDGTLFLTVSTTLGSAFDVAFDVAGHAWVSGGSGVEEFDANGNTK